MTDKVENLILERLRRTDDGLQELRLEFRDVKLRMTAVEGHLLSIQTSILAPNPRMGRFERVERRLDLKDAS